MGLWYGGGKARAPMSERLDTTSAERRGKDLDAINPTGFNTVKTCTESPLYRGRCERCAIGRMILRWNFRPRTKGICFRKKMTAEGIWILDLEG